LIALVALIAAARAQDLMEVTAVMGGDLSLSTLATGLTATRDSPVLCSVFIWTHGTDRCVQFFKCAVSCRDFQRISYILR